VVGSTLVAADGCGCACRLATSRAGAYRTRAQYDNTLAAVLFSDSMGTHFLRCRFLLGLTGANWCNCVKFGGYPSLVAVLLLYGSRTSRMRTQLSSPDRSRTRYAVRLEERPKNFTAGPGCRCPLLSVVA